ncbi:MAG: NAD(P)H-hydrate dehydratase [Phycisphaerales bacterium]|nr:NAD(P)H-hydrate dehydratase [Phycisphaerales bacterium]
MIEQVHEPPCLPPRDPDGHKGTFGTVAVVGGHSGDDGTVMIGAPCLAANAALRCGAGLAVLMMPATVLRFGMQIAPCATAVELPVDDDDRVRGSEAVQRIDAMLPTIDCLAVGPGLGMDKTGGAPAIVLRAIWQEDVPIVIDADGLNQLATMPNAAADFHASAVLTPHPGEYRRLAASLSIDADPVNPRTRPEAAALLAQRLGCIVVLKGPGTIITDGQRFCENPTGNAVLAAGGSGDVLTGIIAGFIAQFVGDLDLFQCAALGAYVHGLAADRWADRHGSAGMLATDLIDEIPGALAHLRRPDAVQ